MTISKQLLRFDEVQTILNCSKDHIYELLRDKKLTAHNPTGKPGTKATKIITASVEKYLQIGVIPASEWDK